jgi:hypothetical protein
MKRLSKTQAFLAAGAIGFAALAAAPAAQAGSDVHFSIGIGAPIGYVQPAPVYVQPQPVYVQPQPVYVQPPRYVQPAPVYYETQPVYVQSRPYHRHGHHGGRRGPWGDADRDGVPNRYDDQPYNPYRN